MALRQRNYTKDEFTERFKSSVVFSAIDAGSYIDWDEIQGQVDSFVDQWSRLESLEGLSEPEFKSELESLMGGKLGEAPMFRLCFRLLGVGKSKENFVVREGAWSTTSGTPVEIEDYGNNELAEILMQAGIQQIVEGGYDIRSLLTGIEVGLESHSRKNRQGDNHEALLKKELEQICAELEQEGHYLELVGEDENYKIDYSQSSGSKTVDFALLDEGRPAIVFEANCYSAQGSKPSEIKRSYETVARKMSKEGIQYVWVTDGYAWKDSLGRILDEAFETHPNLYNLQMVRDELGNDILAFLNDDTKADTQKEVDPQSRLSDSEFDS